MTVDVQVWTHLNCLKGGGFPALLWDTLNDFGYTAYPEYSARELMTTGQLLRCEVKVKIPMCPAVTLVCLKKPSANLYACQDQVSCI
jgi:hypothetical protein